MFVIFYHNVLPDQRIQIAVSLRLLIETVYGFLSELSRQNMRLDNDLFSVFIGFSALAIAVPSFGLPAAIFLRVLTICLDRSMPGCLSGCIGRSLLCCAGRFAIELRYRI